jgi:hypothetical protein
MCALGRVSSPTVRLPPAQGAQPALPAPVEKPLALLLLAAHTAFVSAAMPTHAVMFVCAAAVAPDVCPLGQAAQPAPAASAAKPVLLYVSAGHTSDVAQPGPAQSARQSHAQLPSGRSTNRPVAPAEVHTGGCAHEEEEGEDDGVSHAAPLQPLAQMHTNAPALASKPSRPPGDAHAGGRGAADAGVGASHTTRGVLASAAAEEDAWHQPLPPLCTGVTHAQPSAVRCRKLAPPHAGGIRPASASSCAFNDSAVTATAGGAGGDDGCGSGGDGSGGNGSGGGVRCPGGCGCGGDGRRGGFGGGGGLGGGGGGGLGGGGGGGLGGGGNGGLGGGGGGGGQSGSSATPLQEVVPLLQRTATVSDTLPHNRLFSRYLRQRTPQAGMCVCACQPALCRQQRAKKAVQGSASCCPLATLSMKARSSRTKT